ncbi:MAG: hypothetical protein GX097_03915 [Methanomicrobiales archaeon]|jgi:hydroxymethylpyrimidine/phosphomethylpyrimidine kinase|nr:hypothetical protein [Methanomicrobiales archaeon]
MQTRDEVKTALQKAAIVIAAGADPKLVPDGGIRMGYALSGARSADEVCSIVQNPPRIGFGNDPIIARVILTIIRHDRSLRAVAGVRCTRKILECITFDHALDACLYAPAPPGSGTMDWSVESCCRDGVPDVIYGQRIDENTVILWIIGETPTDVARNIIMLSGSTTNTSL